MIKFNCPECQTQMEAPSSLAGDDLKCPGCGYRVKVPTPAKHSLYDTFHDDKHKESYRKSSLNSA